MTTQKAISLKVYDELLQELDATLETNEKRNQAINKAIAIYLELVNTIDTLDHGMTPYDLDRAIRNFFKSAMAIRQRWRVR